MPVFRIPQPEAETAAEATRTMVRTPTQSHKTEPEVRAMTKLVGLTCHNPNPRLGLLVAGPEITFRSVETYKQAASCQGAPDEVAVLFQ